MLVEDVTIHKLVPRRVLEDVAGSDDLPYRCRLLPVVSMTTRNGCSSTSICNRFVLSPGNMVQYKVCRII
jgi:hypothetical protein